MPKFVIWKIVRIHLKQVRLSLFFFMFVICAIVAIIFFFSSVLGITMISIAPGKSNEPDAGIFDSIFGIGSIANETIFNSTILVPLSIMIVYYIAKIFANETKNGQMLFWLSNPINRTQIFAGKVLFLFLTSVICVLPVYLFLLLSSLFTLDRSEHYILLLSSLITWILFVFMVISLLLLVYFIFNKWGELWIFINIILIMLIILASIFRAAELMYDDDGTMQILAFIFRYFSLQSLYKSFLYFGNENPIIYDQYYHIGRYISSGTLRSVSLIVADLSIMSGCVIGSWVLFKNKDFNL